MKNNLVTLERNKNTSTPTLDHITDRWGAPNWPLDLGKDRGVRHRSRQQCRSVRRVPDGGTRGNEFTLEEHLKVQAQIERRAYELWRAGGGRSEAPLGYWLQAEAEVVREFCQSRGLSSSLRL